MHKRSLRSHASRLRRWGRTACGAEDSTKTRVAPRTRLRGCAAPSRSGVALGAAAKEEETRWHGGARGRTAAGAASANRAKTRQEASGEYLPVLAFERGNEQQPQPAALPVPPRVDDRTGLQGSKQLRGAGWDALPCGTPARKGV